MKLKNEWVNEWMSEWMNEWMAQEIKIPYHESFSFNAQSIKCIKRWNLISDKFYVIDYLESNGIFRIFRCNKLFLQLRWLIHNSVHFSAILRRNSKELQIAFKVEKETPKMVKRSVHRQQPDQITRIHSWGSRQVPERWSKRVRAAKWKLKLGWCWGQYNSWLLKKGACFLRQLFVFRFDLNHEHL